jgi:hypothetical protein
LRWAGHVIRMDNVYSIKNTTFSELKIQRGGVISKLRYSYCLVTLAVQKGKRCCGAREAVRLLWWHSELLPKRKILPMETTQCTIHMTTLQEATFQTGSTHADLSWYDCSLSSARDGMTPLPRLEFRGTNSTLLFTDEKYCKQLGIVNTLRTGRHFSSFWLLNVADWEPLMWLLRHALFQSTIHFSGAIFLLTIGPKCFV